MKNLKFINAALVMLSMGLMLGCGDNKKDSARGPGGPNTNCVGCGQGATNLKAAGFGYYRVGADLQMQMGIQVYSQNATPTPGPGQTVQTVSAVGPVYANGYIHVDTASMYDCPVHTGRYNIRTPQINGQWAGNSGAFDLYNFRFEAVHGDGTVLGLRINYGEFYDGQQYYVGLDGYQYPLGFYGEVQIESLNNQPCGYFGPIKLFFPYMH